MFGKGRCDEHFVAGITIPLNPFVDVLKVGLQSRVGKEERLFEGLNRVQGAVCDMNFGPIRFDVMPSTFLAL